MTEIGGGKLLAIPYRGLALGADLNSRIIQHAMTKPSWFSTPLTPDEIRLETAQTLTDPLTFKWEVWNGGHFVGLLLLHDVTPGIDAIFHFMLFPASETGGATLFGSRKLLWNFLGHVFEAFDLRRISAEVPEHASRLAHFLRQRLGFRYEGENDMLRLQRNKALSKVPLCAETATWVASHGSRREQSHWNADKGVWSDLLLLRILRTEYDARASSGEMPKATRETPFPETHEGAHEQEKLVWAGRTQG